MNLKKLGNLTTREKVALGAGGVIFFLFLADLLVVGRVTDAFKLLGDEIWDAEQHLRKNYGILDNRAVAEKEYNRVSGLLAAVTSSSEARNDLTMEVDDIAERNNLNSNSISTREPRRHPKGYYEEYIVDIGSFDTEMADLLKFLHEISMSPGMLRVSELTVRAVKNKTTVSGSMIITKVMKPGGESGVVEGGKAAGEAGIEQ